MSDQKQLLLGNSRGDDNHFQIKWFSVISLFLSVIGFVGSMLIFPAVFAFIGGIMGFVMLKKNNGEDLAARFSIMFAGVGILVSFGLLIFALNWRGL